MNATQLTLEQKRELVRRLLREKNSRQESVFPLSQGQRGLWFVYHLAPESPAYNFLYGARVPDDVDPIHLRRACQALMDRHPALRTTFEVHDHRPMQRVHDRLDVPLEERDALGWQREKLLHQLRAAADKPFDLERGPAFRASLFRLPDGERVLALVVHHIIADLWSLDLLIQELCTLYSDPDADLSSPRSQFADHVRWQSAFLESPQGRKTLEFWKEKLSGELPVLRLPTDRPRPPVVTYRGADHTWPLNAGVVARVGEFARNRGATLFTTLLSAYQVLLHRYSGQDDLLIGTTLAGRSRPEWDGVVGYFLNQVVLRADLSDHPSFATLVQRTRREMLHAIEHGDYPFSLLVEKLQPARDSSRSPIFQAAFIWDKPRDLAVPSASGLRLEPLLMEQRGAPFDLALIIFEVGKSFTASLRYNTDLFDAATMARMAEHLNTLLAGIADDPMRRVSDLPLLPTDERCRLLLDWNDSRHGPLHPATAHLRFEDQARHQPHALAVEFEERRLSYAELNQRANQLARHLRGRGVGPGTIVGICLPRSPEMIVVVLAVWKAGAAYVPLDPLLPARRLTWMIEDCRPILVLTQPGVAELVGAEPIHLEPSWTAFDNEDSSDLNTPLEPDDLAYVCYTSGSTGRPKGVLICHRGLANLCESQQQVYRLGAERRVLQFASLCFDASVYDIVMALASGGTLVLAPHAATLPGKGLVDLLRSQRINLLTLPPSVLAMLPHESLPDLDTITVAGEACPASLVVTWSVGRTLLNAYGPTESTVWATVAPCLLDESAPPIGRPIVNTRCYVLDAHLQPSPIGVPGELHLAGPGLALGYLNQPELTARQFIANPFAVEDGDTLYKTGDLVRWRPDGQLEFLGRIDQQVKLRGYRIELGEIEAVLRQHPTVRDAVVLPRQHDARGPDRLVAFVVADGGVPDDLASFLRERLPHYMLPATTVALTELPLTPSGKADRAALARLELETTPATSVRTPPGTPAEIALAEVWAKVLQVAKVGVEDNFFDLGGASIQTLEVVNVAAESGWRIAPEMLFRHQTLGELAAAAMPSTPAPKPSFSRDASGVREPARTPEASRLNGKALDVGRTLIESLGVYLPPREVSTDNVLANCRRPLQFPLQRFTGIRSRRMAGDNEFAIDLAAQAVSDCFHHSAVAPTEVDLLICCNISRCDGPNGRFSFEPTTAAKLRRRFGMINALAFDVSNACAGTFTGIAIADAFLQTGLARRALVVSGEYITHLTRTAQKEIDGFLDPRLACLTLGDAGCALMLTRSSVPGAGFLDLEMFTLGDYHNLCVAKMSRESPGAVMVTDAVKSSAVTIGQAVEHALGVLRRRHWAASTVDQLILHQTSETTLDGAVQEINRALGQPVCHRDNVAYNLAERGNTATTTHWVALRDGIRAGRFRSGSKVLFGISGSGQTVGTALYQMDDLPERLQRESPNPRHPEPPPPSVPPARFRIAAVGTLDDAKEQPLETVALLRAAGESCLGQWSRPREEIDLILSSSVYRSEFLSEPALAAIAAGELKINHTPAATRKSLAFDLMNGAAGTLTACHVASQMLKVRGQKTALILASEIENNADVWPEKRLGLKPTASALVLEQSTSDEGFRGIVIRSFPEHLERFSSFTGLHHGQGILDFVRDPELEARLLECIAVAVEGALKAEGLTLEDMKVILPPHRSLAFIERLAAVLRVSESRIVGLPDSRRDYFTSSLAWTFQMTRQRQTVKPGDLGLIIDAGCGIQVGCAVYRF